MRDDLTLNDFLSRCETAWKMGLVTPERLRLLCSWTDGVMRADQALFGGNGDDQFRMVKEFLSNEERRLRDPDSKWGDHKTLANDADGYALVQLASLLNHPCQKCATDPNAWHTRYAFCEHKDEVHDG